MIPSPSLFTASSIRRTVTALLARHAGRAVSEIQSCQDLEHDLDLTPLDLVLVAVEIEEAEGISLPVEGLESVVTVGDALRFFCWTLGAARRGVPEDRPSERRLKERARPSRTRGVGT